MRSRSGNRSTWKIKVRNLAELSMCRLVRWALITSILVPARSGNHSGSDLLMKDERKHSGPQYFPLYWLFSRCLYVASPGSESNWSILIWPWVDISSYLSTLSPSFVHSARSLLRSVTHLETSSWIKSNSVCTPVNSEAMNSHCFAIASSSMVASALLSGDEVVDLARKAWCFIASKLLNTVKQVSC